ncbi:MAG: 50S ribosomal protein L11 methyltransferase [Kiritimatiellaeota bacterium]|nr:50S ribosomal protein L11 methyltransferase [Kiritimatiellota bacterium]
MSCSIPQEAVDALFELLDTDTVTPTAWYDAEAQQCRIDLFLEDASQAGHAADTLIATAALQGLSLTPKISTLDRANWTEAWKRFFHVEKISNRVVVRPSWEPYDVKPGDCVITIDPGLSFGTGKHATTQACLQFLDRLAAEDKNRSVLDMGCGSGILAIGAALLGFTDVRGFDNDPTCKTVSEENAAINNVSLPIAIDDLTHTHPPADIVVANILAPLLIQFAPQIAGSMTQGPRSRLILSGILDAQYEAVKTAYEAQGLREHENSLLENWRTGLFGSHDLVRHTERRRTRQT